MKILVLSLPLGDGHAAVAAAAGKLLEGTAEFDDVAVMDLAEQIHVGGRRLSTLIRGFYGWAVSTAQGRPYAAIYAMADKLPRVTLAAADVLFGGSVQEFLQTQRADVIVSTYPLISDLATRRGGGRPVVTMVTDLGNVNRIWWAAGRDAALTLVMTPQTRTAALRAGVDAEQVQCVGLIVGSLDGAAEDTPDHTYTETRVAPVTALSLDKLESPFTVMLAAGGQGYGPAMTATALQLAKSVQRDNIRYFVAVGDNDTLRDLLLSTLGSQAVVAPRSGAHQLLNDVDIVVGKAGGVTVSECMATGTPMLITDRIAGQEVENARLAVEVGVARISSSTEAAALIEKYAHDRGSLNRDFPRMLPGAATVGRQLSTAVRTAATRHLGAANQNGAGDRNSAGTPSLNPSTWRRRIWRSTESAALKPVGDSPTGGVS